MAATKPKTATWNALPTAEKKRVAAKMLAMYRTRVKAFAAGKYNIVGSAKHRSLRERPQIETGGEDDALTATLRHQFFNLARNSVRNNETLNGILTQFRLNVVGTEGGKAYFDFGEEFKESAEILKRAFSKFTASCEFFDGADFNECLKIILQTLIVCGDVALVFDDDYIEGSGKLLAFEPDSIANISDAEFQKRFPGYTQSQGRIKNQNGRFVGLIVSSSERGKPEFDATKVLFFTKDPNAAPDDCDWTLVARRWRFNQGRGTPPLSAPLAALMDVNALLGYEVESAKKNSQTYAQLIQTGNNQSSLDAALADPSLNSEPGAASGVSGGADDPSDAEIAEGVKEAEELAEPEISFDELESAGAMFDVMPENAKLELLDTKHPNPNMPAFINLVACRGGWSMGICSCFTTGTVSTSYTAFRGEQLMTQRAFEEFQKFLERNVCSWVLARWFAWATKRGEIPANLALPEDWMRRVRWFFPAMREVNAVDAQNAWNAGLKNGTLGYADILGPDWRERLADRGNEIAFCEKIGFIHPSRETVSGQLVPQGANKGEEHENVQGE